ncbi:MAG: hypothetical protein ABEH38_02030 [Flavobacteriales bacterium]
MERCSSLILPSMVLLFLTSCGPSIDRAKSPSELGKNLHQALIKDDSSTIDTLIEGEKTNMARVWELASMVEKEDALHRKKSNEDSVELTFRLGGRFFVLSGPVEKIKKDHFRLKQANRIDLSKRCEDYKKQRYQPNDKVLFKDLQVKTKDGKNSFKSARILVENKLDRTITAIKVRVKIYMEQKEGSQMIYRRPITPDKNLPKKEVTSVPLPKIKGYSPGGPIDTSTMRMETQILDLAPKPPNKWCQKVKQLEGAGDQN